MVDIPPPPGYSLVEQPDAEPPPPPGFDVIPDAAVPPPVGFKVVNEPAPKGATPGERVLDKGPIGRVLDSFGQGLKDGWGSERIGLSDESNDALRKAGIFAEVDANLKNPFKVFNEALIRPVAAGLDATMRGISAVGVGVAATVGQTAEELGADQGMAKRLTRDTLELANALGVTTGTAPFGLKPRIDPATRNASNAVNKTVNMAAKVEAPEYVLANTEEVVDAAGNINLKRIRAPEDVLNVIREASLREVPVKADPVGDPLALVIEVKNDFNSADDLSAFLAEVQGKSSKAPFVTLKDGSTIKLVNTETPEGSRVAVALDSNGDMVGALSYEKVLQPDGTPFNPDVWVEEAWQRKGVATALYDAADRSGGRIPAVDAPSLRTLEGMAFRQARGEGGKTVATAQPATETGFMSARRGVIPLKETEGLADALGMTPADLAKRNIGQAFNAEEAVAARNLLVQSATEVRNLAAKASGGADTDVLAFQEAMTKHMAIQEQVAGMTAEAGRALSAFRIMAKGTNEAVDLGKLIEDLGGRATIDDIARKINQFDTPEQISQFLMDSRKVSMSDMALEVWMNSLLSGPTTHMTNILSNSLNAIWAVPETAVAAGVGAIRRGMGGTGEAVLFGEVGARAFGIVQGAKDGIIAGWRTFQTEIPSAGPNKLETPRPRAIPSKQVQIGDTTIEVGGKQVRIPGRLLMAEDEVFKGIAYRQELNALAYRQAAKEGLDGQAFAARVTELTNKPTDAFVRKASENADYQTFTKELGPTGKALMQFVNTHPALRIPFTFIRTPTNILKYAGERTPLAVFSKIVRDELSGAKGSITRDTQIARVVLGTTVMTAAAGLAAEGLITGGGPKDPRERAVLYLNGWQPYSVKVGDMYYSYGRIEPLGLIMGVAADAQNLGAKMTDPEAEDIGMLGAIAVAKNLTSKTWLRGPAELMQAVTDPERYGETWLRKLAGTAVPTIMAQGARLEDPYLREANSIFEAIQARTPGLSAALLPRRDIWGEPIALEGALGPDFLSPIYESKIKNDPTNQELLTLKIWPSKLEKQIRGVELTPDQYDDFQRVAGRFAKFSVDSIVKQPGWGDLPEFARKEIIGRTITNSRETGRQWMLMTYPNILKDATDAKVKQISGAK